MQEHDSSLIYDDLKVIWLKLFAWYFWSFYDFETKLLLLQTNNLAYTQPLYLMFDKITDMFDKLLIAWINLYINLRFHSQY